MRMRAMAAAAIVAVAAAAATAAAAAEKVALLIGNADYQHTGALRNPVNDVRLMARKLEGLGFETTIVEDADRLKMARAIKAFGQQSIGADTSLVFYSGHGMEAAGRNFLIPTDAKLEFEDDAELEAISLRTAITAAGRASRLSVVIVDACRNNTFPSSSRSGAKGFQPVAARPGQAIAFSTAPGEVAYDGNGDLSPFTRALSEALADDPDEDVRILLTSLGAATERYAGAPQSPFTRFGHMPRGAMTLTGAPLGGGPAAAPEGPAEVPAVEAPEVEAPGVEAPEEVEGPAEEEIAGADAPAARGGGASAIEEEAPAEPAFSKAELMDAQRYLRALGYYGGGIDGDWGPGSRAAMRLFNADKGLPEGEALTPINVGVLRALGEEAMRRQEAEAAAMAAERAAAEERQRALAEEQRRLELERQGAIAREEAARREAERQEAARREAERQAREKEREREVGQAIGGILGGILAGSSGGSGGGASPALANGVYVGAWGGHSINMNVSGGRPTTGSLTMLLNNRRLVTGLRFDYSGGVVSGIVTAAHPEVKVQVIRGTMPNIRVRVGLSNGGTFDRSFTLNRR